MWNINEIHIHATEHGIHEKISFHPSKADSVRNSMRDHQVEEISSALTVEVDVPSIVFDF